MKTTMTTTVELSADEIKKVIIDHLRLKGVDNPKVEFKLCSVDYDTGPGCPVYELKGVHVSFNIVKPPEQYGPSFGHAA